MNIFKGTYRRPASAVSRSHPAALGEPPAAECWRHPPLHQLPAGRGRLRDILLLTQADRA